MFFVLPGRDGAPVETLRYEALRVAAQDYELLKLVERALPEDRAQAAIQAAMDRILQPGALEHLADPARAAYIGATALYSLDPEDYQAARRTLLAALSQTG
jgi:hypothetical protein